MKLSLTAKTTIGIAIAGGLLINIGSISCQQCAQQLSTSQLVADTQNIIGALDATNASLTDLENNEYIYFMSGTNKAKASLDRVVRSLNQQLTQLQTSMQKSRKGDQHLQEVKSLADKTAERVAKARWLIEHRNRADFKSSEAREIASASQLSKEIRSDIAKLKLQENVSLAGSSQALQLVSLTNIMGIIVMMAFVFVMLLVILLTVVLYVDERKKAEANLLKAERRFKAVFNQTFQFTNLLSPDGLLLESSHNVLDFAGVEQEQVTGKPFWEMPWWPQSESTRDTLKQAIQQASLGNFVRFEEEQIGSDGRLTVDVSVKPVKDENGHIVMLIPEARDITERKLAEHAIADREARMLAIFDTAPDVILTVAPGGRIDAANAATMGIFGYSPEELIGRNVNTVIDSFFHAGEFEHRPTPTKLSGLSEIVTRGRESVGRHKDGSEMPIELAVSVLDLGEQQILTAIVRDITERKEAEKRVSEFYSTVSHELRTPLTSIRTALGLLESGSLMKVSTQGSQLLRIARSECDRLIRLINDILDIRKIESGKVELRLQNVQPSVLVEFTFKALSSIAKESQVELVSEINDQCQLSCDQDRIVQVLTNLVSNAIRFSPRGASVLVKVERVPETGACRFSVVDQGPGIPTDQVHRLFDKFQQIDHGSGQIKGGTGLGLAIVKALVIQHGGRVGVITGPEQGCTFWFEVAERIVTEEPVNMLATDSGRVLVIADDDEVADLLNGLLSNGGYEMVRADSIAEANRCLTERQPNIVLLDVHLPDGNGLDVVNTCMLQKGHKALPIVILPDREPTQDTLGNPVLIDWFIESTSDRPLGNLLEEAIQEGLPRSKVLIVSESAETKQFLFDQLEDLDIKCFDGSDGGSFQQLIENNAPDLIVLDVEVAQDLYLKLFQVLRQEKLRTIPVVAYVTDNLCQANFDKLTLAFSRYLSKTYLSESEFLSALRELLDSRLRRARRSGAAISAAEPEVAVSGSN